MTKDALQQTYNSYSGAYGGIGSTERERTSRATSLLPTTTSSYRSGRCTARTLGGRDRSHLWAL